jgi:uncharacterized protein (UPF0254 family)
MKVWVTKYLFTDGIIEMSAHKTHSPRMVEVPATKSAVFTMYIHKPDWHASLEEAVVYAEQKREKKLSSMKRQMQKITNMNFSIPKIGL